MTTTIITASLAVAWGCVAAYLTRTYLKIRREWE